jgi:tetratricopeptide (TPR) repeat protein
MLVLTLAFTCGVLRADTIYMLDTDRKIVGVVHRETDDFIIVLLKGDKGQIKIYRNKIKSIEYDIKTQLDKLAEDDYAGRYKVGIWAMEKGKFADAADLFETLKGKEGVGPDMLKQLGQAYEQRKQLDKALENYIDYARANPEDQQVAARIVELNKEVNPGGADAPGKQITEGIEATGTWQGEQWDYPCKAQIYTETKSGVNKMVLVQSKGGEKDKTAFTRQGDLNLSDRTEMQFNISLADCPTPINVAVAFVNSKNEFLESKRMRVNPNLGWVKLSIKLDSQEFKAQRTDWTHKLSLEGKDRVSKIHFLVYGQRPFTLYADGIYFK